MTDGKPKRLSHFQSLLAPSHFLTYLSKANLFSRQTTTQKFSLLAPFPSNSLLTCSSLPPVLLSLAYETSFFFFFFLLVRVAFAAYRSSQARGQIRATVAGHSHSNMGSQPESATCNIAHSNARSFNPLGKGRD